MGKLNKSGKGGKRSNAPAANDKANAGDADARKYANFAGVGGSVGDPLGGGGGAKGGK